MNVLAVVTHGRISPSTAAEVPSGDGPEMLATIELKPEMRGAFTNPDDPVGTPHSLTAQELKPEMVGAKGPEQPDPDPKPSQISAQELKPIMKGAKEE